MKAYLRKVKHFFFPPISFLEKERRSLAKLPTEPLLIKNLAPIKGFDKQAAFGSHSQIWDTIKHEIHDILPEKDTYAGVSLGDRKAVHALVHYLQPTSILEVGTNIGASTIHFVHALRHFQQQNPQQDYRLITVDILDVNAPDAPWKEENLPYPPQTMMQHLNFAEHVNFVVQDALAFLKESSQNFDFIFLDGNHAAAAVYQEIAASLRVLNPHGYILLHDYFPNLDPLWDTGAVIPGPWLAAERLRLENPKIEVLPLGALPWETKPGSTMTSLALVGKAD